MKTVAIFGCGSAGQRTYFHHRSKSRVLAFLDNDRSRHGTQVLGVPVRDPEVFNYAEIDHVLIASMYLDQILVQLLALGVPSSKIEYVSDDVMMRDATSALTGSPVLSRLVAGFETLYYLPFRVLRKVA